MSRGEYAFESRIPLLLLLDAARPVPLAEADAVAAAAVPVPLAEADAVAAAAVLGLTRVFPGIYSKQKRRRSNGERERKVCVGKNE